MAILFIIFIISPFIYDTLWIILSAIIIGILILTIMVSRSYPYVLILKRDTALFIGFPWVFQIRREKMEQVIIANYGFWFIPKNKNDYRWGYTWKKGKLKDYKHIGFLNLEAWGAIIEFLNPVITGSIIDLEPLKEKEISYIEKRMSQINTKNINIDGSIND